jgi:hypothetical protein
MKISFIGNCQVLNLAACAQAMVPDATVQCVVPNDSFEPARNSDIVFIQTGIWLDVEGEFPGSLVKKVPNFCYWAFQPDLVFAFVGDVPVNSPMDSYNSALALYGWLNDLSVSQTVGLFCNPVYDRLGYYNYTEPSRRFMIEAGSHSDMDMAPLIEEWNKRGCFTYSINHPKLFVLSSIARAALEKEGVKTAVTNCEAGINDLFATCIWPVYPEIAERLAIPGNYQFENRGTIDLEQFVEGSFASYAAVPKEKIRVERFAEQSELYRHLEKLVPGRRRKESNPYSRLPDHCFWQRAVANVAPSELDPVVDPKFWLVREDKIATAGSCFAQHIAKTLIREHYNYFVSEQPPAELSPEVAAAKGYGLFSARFGNVYTVRQLLQLLQRAYSEFVPKDIAWLRHDGKFIDPFRPQLEPDGYRCAEDVAEARIEHFAAVRRMFEQSDLFVFTIGLTEAWAALADGAVFPVAPGVVSDKVDATEYGFRNFTVSEIIADLNDFIQRLRAINSKVRVLFTVSPVPLIATYENRHALVSTTYSKSAIRAAVGEVVQQYDFVDYFPSYEVITGWYNNGRYFESDLRSVTEEGVGHVMRLFSKHYLQSATAADQSPKLILREKEIAQAAKIICDEELLDNTGTRQGRNEIGAEIADPAGTDPTLKEFYALAEKSGKEASLLREMLGRESASRDALAARIDKEISGLHDVLAREAVERRAERSQIESRIADGLDALRVRHDEMQGTLESLVDGAQTWLLPILAKHSAAIERRRHPFGALRQLVGRLGRPTRQVGRDSAARPPVGTPQAEGRADLVAPQPQSPPDTLGTIAAAGVENSEMHPTLELYATQQPTPQATADIFKDVWLSTLPEGLRSGSMDMFHDPRVALAHRFFDFSRKSVLELGPLEGGHTYGIHALGASSITAVEGNSRSFLKCLVVKELFGLSRANFLYGDIIKYLEATDAKFDVIFASGVLYHMKEPLKLLSLLRQHTDRCYIWTGFYQRDVMLNAYGEERFAIQFGQGVPLEYGGFQCEGYPQYYLEALDLPPFAGGAAPSSMWLRKDDIVNFLGHVGFNDVSIHDVDTSFGYAPRLSIIAQVR